MATLALSCNWKRVPSGAVSATALAICSAATGTADSGGSPKATPPATMAASDSVLTLTPSDPTDTSIPEAFQKRVRGVT